MDQYLTIEQINNINNNIKLLYTKIKDYKDIIINIQNEIEDNKNILIHNCNHNPKIDYNNRGEHTEYYCSICKMDL